MTDMTKSELLDLVKDYETLVDSLEDAVVDGDLEEVRSLLTDWDDDDDDDVNDPGAGA